MSVTGSGRRRPPSDVDLQIHTFDSWARAVAAAVYATATKDHEFNGDRVEIPCTISLEVGSSPTFATSIQPTAGICIDITGTSYCIGLYTTPHAVAEKPSPNTPEGTV